MMADSLPMAAQVAMLKFLSDNRMKTNNAFHIPAYDAYVLSKAGINSFDGSPEHPRFESAIAWAASHPQANAFQSRFRATQPDPQAANLTASQEKAIAWQRAKLQHDLDKNEYMKALFLFGLDTTTSLQVASLDGTHGEYWELREKYLALGTPDKFTDKMLEEIQADLITTGLKIEEATIILRRTLAILTLHGHMTAVLALQAVYDSIEAHSGGKRMVIRYKQAHPGQGKTSDGFLEYSMLHWPDRELDPLPHPVLAAADDTPRGRERKGNRNGTTAAAADGFANGGGGRARRTHLTALEYFNTPSPRGQQPPFVAPPAADRYDYCFSHGWNKSHIGKGCRSLKNDLDATTDMKAATSPAPLVSNKGIRYLASSEIRPN